MTAARRLTLLLCAALALLAVPLPAQEGADLPRWIALFERSAGSEGLYTTEMHPPDDEGASRLNLQDLNAAARRLRQQGIRRPPTAEDMVARGVVPALRPHPAEESYLWDDARGCFESTLGGRHSTTQGALALLRANADVRQRMQAPDPFVRRNWKLLYESPDVPPFLRNEILLREFLLDKFAAPSALKAERVRETLVAIEEGIKLFAIREQRNIGQAVTLDELVASRLIGTVERPPDDVEVIVQSVGQPPRAILEGHEITTDPASVTAYHRAKAEKAWLAYPQFPPAIALRARFEPQAEALRLIDSAVMRWPDVPGLRIERMAHNARAGRFDAWREDLGFLLEHFPSAPILFEAQAMAEEAGVLADNTERARLATALADIRPDLLTHQLSAIQALVDAGKADAARLVYTRLAAAHPGWAQVLPAPGADTEKPR